MQKRINMGGVSTLFVQSSARKVGRWLTSGNFTGKQSFTLRNIQVFLNDKGVSLCLECSCKGCAYAAHLLFFSEFGIGGRQWVPIYQLPKNPWAQSL